MLAAEGCPPLYVSGPLYRNRHDDFDAPLEVQLRSRWDSWIDFFTQAVMSACDELFRAPNSDCSLFEWAMFSNCVQSSPHGGRSR